MRQIMVECAVRAALIAIGTAAALGLLRVKSAGARHAAWTGVVALMLLLPVWMAWGPRASLPVLPASPMAVAAVTPIVIPISEPDAAAPAPTPVAPRAPWDWLAIMYGAGASLLLARLALGTIRARMLMSVAAPVTVGLLRPRVILPDDWRDWPQAQLDAVLTHEGEHVRRRDPLVKWLALFNRAIFWFHPLAWWLERHLSALAEEACDAAVLEHGHDAHEYTGYLLEMARSVGQSGVRVKAVTMAMPGSSLPQRVRQILSSGPAPRISRVRAACLATSCALLSAAFAAASIDRESFIADLPLPLAVPAAPMPVATDIPFQAPVAPAPALPQESKYGDHRLLVFYFETNEDPAQLLVEKSAASTFLRDKAPSNDLIAIMTSGRSGVKVVEDFTADRDRLDTDLRRMNADPGPSAESGEVLAGMLTATRMLGALPQKKQVIYFAAGFIEKTSQEERQDVVNAALRANVAFYPIDAAGLANVVPQTISPGDTVSIFGLGTDVVTGAYTVRADGMIALPLLGDIKAEGLTPPQLQAAINKVTATLGDPSIIINLAGVRQGGK
jgi:hypothetical protein